MPRSPDSVYPYLAWPRAWWMRLCVVAAAENVQPPVFVRRAVMQAVNESEGRLGIEGGLDRRSDAEVTGKLKRGGRGGR